MDGNKKKFVVPVTVNKEQVGSLVCQCNHEKWFKDVKGNIIDSTSVDSSYINKYTKKEIIEYTNIVKIKVNATIEDIKEVTKVVKSPDADVEFADESIDFANMFISGEIKNTIISETEEEIGVERKDDVKEEVKEEREVTIEVENEVTIEVESEVTKTAETAYNNMVNFEIYCALEEDDEEEEELY